MTPWLAALLCVTLTPVTKATDDVDAPKAKASQQTTADPKSDEQGMQPDDMTAQSSQQMGMEFKSNEGPPTRANKARSILGMKVRNQSNQYLGRIKDLVIDWQTEQVAYAVLSTGDRPPFGQGGKLLAVPLTALTSSADQKHLILNADKSKVEAATGFESANWPSVSNPSWGAQPFWQKGSTTTPMGDQPAKESDPKANQNMTLGAGSATEPESFLGEEPSVAPDRDSPAKPDAAPESKPSGDAD